MPRVAVVAAVCLPMLLAGAPDMAGSEADDPGRGADAVVAFVDSGINPYHEAFRDDDPRYLEHPSTYLRGYPQDAVALDLTLDAPAWSHAVGLDCAIWAKVEPGQLYWVPGTRIVGAISFDRELAEVGCPMSPEEVAALDPEEGSTSTFTGEPPVLDVVGHGTMVASRGAGAGYGACPSCLVVAVQMRGTLSYTEPTGTEASPMAAIKWAADNNDWIDIQSNSWGPLLPVWDPTAQGGLFVTSPETARTIEDVSQRQPAFWSSGNGAARQFGGVGHPTAATPHLGPSAFIVGGHDSGRVNIWPGFPPHVVADSCNAWAAAHDSMDHSDETISSGTSGATPYVAGSAGQILRTARALLVDQARTGIEDGKMASGIPTSEGPLADGALDRDEFRRLVLATATARPEPQHEDGPPCLSAYDSPHNTMDLAWSDVPDAYPAYLHLGYGAVDRVAVALAAEVLAGDTTLPDRPAEDQFFAVHEAARTALHTVWTTG